MIRFSVLTYHGLDLVLDDPDQHLVDVDAQVVHHMAVLRQVKVPQAVIVLPVGVLRREALRERERKTRCLLQSTLPKSKSHKSNIA